MAFNNSEYEASLFEGLIPGEARKAYARLLKTDGIPASEAGELGDGTAQLLQDLGMARVITRSPASPPWLIPASPGLALQGVMAHLSAQLSGTIEQLRTGMDRSAAAHGRHCSDHDNAEHLVRLLTDRTEIVRQSIFFCNTARRDFMAMENTVRETTPNDTVRLPAEIRARIRQRAIYDDGVLNDPHGKRLVKASIEEGEEARRLPVIKTKLQIVDDTAVLLPLTWTGMGAAAVIHAEPIAVLAREYYEFQWDRADPLTPNARKKKRKSPFTPREQQILDLMATGKQDAEIARILRRADGTIHAHAQNITHKLGAKNRIQAVAIAVLHGWVNFLPDDESEKKQSASIPPQAKRSATRPASRRPASG